MIIKLLKFFFNVSIYYSDVYLNRLLSKKISNRYFHKISEEVKKEGICVIPNFISKKESLKIRKDLEPILKKLVKKPLNKRRYFRDSYKGIFRLYQIKKIISKSQKFFFNNYVIKNFSKYYISNNVEFYQDMAEIRQPLKKKLSLMRSSSDNYHFDDWKIRLKYFLILSDVTKDDAPMCYIKKSHKLMLFKKKFEYFYNGKLGNYGYFSNNEVKKLKKKYDLKEEICTCKIGTLIVVDTRGIHKGTPLRRINNPRIQLGLYSDTRQKKWNPKNINI